MVGEIGFAASEMKLSAKGEVAPMMSIRMREDSRPASSGWLSRLPDHHRYDCLTNPRESVYLQRTPPELITRYDANPFAIGPSLSLHHLRTRCCD